MGILKRIFGICETKKPIDGGCWSVADGQVAVDLTRAVELRLGGALRLEGKDLPERILVLPDGNDGYRAYRNRCTHAGRRLDPLDDSGSLRCCSVSKSTFDAAGNKVSGPAKGSVDTFPTTVEKKVLYIKLQ